MMAGTHGCRPSVTGLQATWRHTQRLSFAAGMVAALWLVPGETAALASEFAELDTALVPILADVPANSDLLAVKAGVTAYFKKDYAGGDAIAAGIKDAVARKLMRWYAMRQGAPGIAPAELEEFSLANPDWPDDALRGKAEELLLGTAGADEILSLLDRSPPITGAGRAALAAALAERGDTKKAAKLARATWHEDDFGKDTEARALARIGGLLTPADHKFRADRILYADSRWADVRAQRLAAARRLLPLLAPGDRAMIQARLAVYACTRGTGCLAAARKAFGALPASAGNDPGIVYHKIQLLRRSNRDGEAWRQMAQVAGNQDGLISPDDWWVERRVNAYAALYGGDPKLAYKIAADHGALTVNPLKDAEFLAGFIALRHLKDAKRALKHFQAMRKAADGPISYAQSDYWLGRTHEVLGDTASAQESFLAAGRQFNTYYGQLARQALDPNDLRLEMPAMPTPSQDEANRFASRDAIRALTIAAKAGVNDLMRVFAMDLRGKLDNEGELVLLAHLTATLGDMQMAVRVSKTAMERGFNLVHYAYPVHGMPKFQALRSLPEEATFFAVARQESEFNTMTKSGAGARGILQLMPVTAKDVCRKYKVKCDLSRLNDAAYNTSLATAYIADRFDDFGGSYIMGFAGYNAGPGRVRQWVGQIGDPRDPAVDPIDWVEMIHIEETREYVKKVLANVQVYRARLGDTKKPLRIAKDLRRGRSGGQNASAN